MRAKLRKFSVFCFLVSVISYLPFGSCEASEEDFIYDSRGRRDPFIPLTDKDSPTGLRRIFVPPEAEVKLPIEITLKGILQKGGKLFAIINDEVMQKGDRIDELEITEVQKDKVILQYNGREFSVPLRKEKEK